MIQQWIPVFEYETLYEVSENGQIRDIQGKMCPIYISGGVYPYTYLRKNITRKKKYVHYIVTSSFIGPKPFSKAEVRHKDGNPLNFFYKNLQWGTRSQNNLDKIRHGTAKRKFTVSEIKRIRKLNLSGVSMQKLSTIYRISINTIFQIISKRTYREIL